MSKAYRAAAKVAGGCPIEAGLLLKLADNECRHGRLPGDRSDPCGCWGIATLLNLFNGSTHGRRRARVAELYEAGFPLAAIAKQVGATVGAVNRDVRHLHDRSAIGRRRPARAA